MTIRPTATLVGILLVALPHAGRAGEASAGAYWSALDHLGYDVAAERVDTDLSAGYIDRLDRFISLLRHHTSIEPEVAELLAEVHSRLLQMDVGHLYDFLPSNPKGSTWRAVGLHGGREAHRYVVRRADPRLEAWVRARSGGPEEPERLDSRFGDLDLRAFVQPVDRNRFLLAPEARLGTGTFSGGNLVRVLGAFLAAAETAARDATDGEEDPEAAGRAVLDSLAAAFPASERFMREVVHAETLLATCHPDGSVTFEIDWMADRKGLAKRYPHLAAMVKNMRKMLYASASVEGLSGSRFLHITFNDRGTLARVRFRSRGGVLHPLGEPPGAGADTLALLDPTRRQMRMVADARLNLAGLRLEFAGVTNRLHYTFMDTGPLLELQLNQRPARVRTSGRMMGILPVWLINLFIPSNLKEMTDAFLAAMVEGRNGAGMELHAGARPGRKDTLWLVLDAEVMSNGTVKFAMGLAQRFTGGRFRAMKDLHCLSYDLWQAFMEDVRLNRVTA